MSQHKQDIDIDQENITCQRTICFPDSVLQQVQTRELQNQFLGQIARICCIFKINKILILQNNQKQEEQNYGELIIKILQYLETPQYLRRRLFPIDKQLQQVGLIQPLQCNHHLRKYDVSEYREGITLKRPTKKNQGTWIDIGLDKECLVSQCLDDNIRVTVQLEDYTNNRVKNYKGNLVSPMHVQKETGEFWGYQVEILDSITYFLRKENEYRILISQGEENYTKKTLQEIKKQLKQKEVNDICLFFTYESLDNLIQQDEQNFKINIKYFKDKFDQRFDSNFINLGVRNLRFEEELFFYCNEIFNQFNNE